MNFGARKAILTAILELSEFDYCGLYETYWPVPEGKVRNHKLNISKLYSLDEVMGLNYKICEKGYAELVFFERGMKEQCNNLSHLKDEESYTPFSMMNDRGYGLSATNKGIELLRRLRVRCAN